MNEKTKELVEMIKKKIEEMKKDDRTELDWFSNEFEPVVSRFCDQIEKSEKDDEYNLRGFWALMDLFSIRDCKSLSQAYREKSDYESEFEEYCDSEAYDNKVRELSKVCDLYHKRTRSFHMFVNAFNRLDKRWHYESTDDDLRDHLNPVWFRFGYWDLDMEMTLHKRNIEALENILGEKFTEFDEFMGR